MDNFTREELMDIRDRAKDYAKTEGLGPSWARAFLSLADAADYCDAINARCEGVEDVSNDV